MATEIRTENAGTQGAWGLILVQGIAAVILGLLLVAAPAASLIVVVTVLGLYWLVAGVLSIVRIFTHHTKLNWFWALAVGILGIAAGLIVLQHPLWSSVIVPAVVVVLLGINALIMGVINLIRGFSGEGGSYVAIGILDLIFGVILLASPLLAGALLPVVLGIFAIAGGIVTIAMSFSVRKEESLAAERPREHRAAA